LEPGTRGRDGRTNRFGRRRFLAGTLCGVASAALPPRALAHPAPRRLRLLHARTAERIDVTYHESGEYLPDALAELDRFLRDFRTGEVHPIDVGVLDVAWSLARSAGRERGTFEVVSAYRSPQTNRMLHERSHRVALGSLHVQGQALDLRLPGVATEHLRDLAIALRRGGVGFYPESDFVHVDTGRVRRW
jgi:uncharacterized protein YcbK (DUF882 family)